MTENEHLYNTGGSIVIENHGSFVKSIRRGDPMPVCAIGLKFSAEVNAHGFLVARQGPVEFSVVKTELPT